MRSIFDEMEIERLRKKKYNFDKEDKYAMSEYDNPLLKKLLKEYIPKEGKHDDMIEAGYVWSKPYEVMAEIDSREEIGKDPDGVMREDLGYKTKSDPDFEWRKYDNPIEDESDKIKAELNERSMPLRDAYEAAEIEKRRKVQQMKLMLELRKAKRLESNDELKEQLK